MLLIAAVVYVPSPSESASEFDYTDWGAVKEVRRANSTKSTYTYTDRGWIDQIMHMKVGWPAAQLLQFHYFNQDEGLPDYVGNPQKLTIQKGIYSRIIHYQYDAGYRLVHEQATGNFGPIYERGMVYDEVGNLVERYQDGATYAYSDDDNQLLDIIRYQQGYPPQICGMFGYDADGNMTYRSFGSTSALTYNCLGEMM